MEKEYQKNRNNHPAVLERKAEKHAKGITIVTTLKNLKKTKKEIIKSLVKSGFKIRHARSIYRQCVAYKRH